MAGTKRGGRPSGEKTRCSGKWTEAKFNSFIKNNLRRASMKWAPITECLRNATTKRGFKLCAGCGEEVPVTIKNPDGRGRIKNVHVDHINPIINPETGFTTWDDCIDNMFSELDNLQVLCKKCHDIKTQTEKDKASKRRGFYKTHPKEYPCYVAMKGRCNNPKKSDYDYYGGRGIKVCDSWNEDFLNFYNDLGDRPEGTTLDRIDPDGDYCPDNCRWATHKIQSNNTRRNVWVEYEGEKKTLAQWCDFTGINRATLAYRLNNNWEVEEALEFVDKPSRDTIKQRREREKNERQ